MEQVRRALHNTIATFVACDNDIPVGMFKMIKKGSSR